MSDRSKQILEYFRKKRPLQSGPSDFVSGEDIASDLGFSRTAVWNHIDTLRKLGYVFEALPRLGYRLLSVPDRLFPDEIEKDLNTQYMGKKIYYYDEIQSTNDLADQLAREGAAEGTLVLTEYQVMGKGRLGRSWFSPKGKNILVSVILRPKIDPSFVSLITIMSSVAVAKTLHKYAFNAQIKWPNDIFIEGKKIAGILTEMKCEQDQVKYLVLGIGMNVNMDLSDIPSSLKGEVNSLSLIKNEKMDRIKILKTLLCELEEVYNLVKKNQYDKILEDWKRLSFLVGRWVEVHLPHKILEGVVLGTDSKGELLLKLENGLLESVISGDVKIMKDTDQHLSN